MRAGGCTVQQALTPEAATLVKQAVSLARRRGHAQVTPLHVANTMLSSSTGLLRAACLQSHSHPLQCKALELCFNVALNRLPASTSSGPMLQGTLPHQTYHHPPSLSNALVAAFKRAQAHQRRGSVESQQQPLLAVKIEIEQLIISILDDPSVSRVMREAGFSSTQVKSNVEQAVSLEICAPSPPPPSSANPTNKPKEGGNNSLLSTTPPQLAKSTRPASDQVRHEDVMTVVESLVSGRNRSVVVVGECPATTEGIVRGVVDKVDKREVPEILRNVQFISLPLFSFGNLSKEEVEQKVGELRCLVKSSSCVGRGAVLYLGDLKWAAEYRASCGGGKGRGYYCPVEHVIMELGRLACNGGIGAERDYSGCRRFWLMGIATYQTYMRCRIGNPSLETLWGLHPLTIPAGISLGLSLSCDSSDLQSQSRSMRSGDVSCWSLIEDGIENQLNCCADCSLKFEIETRSLSNSYSSSNHGSITTSSLPLWLQQYKEENTRATTNDQDKNQIRDLCKKWNSICNTFHKHHHQLPEKTLNFSSVSPSSSSIVSYEQHFNLHQTHQAWPVPINTKHSWRENFWISDGVDEGFKPNSRSYLLDDKRINSANPNLNPISTSSSDTMEMDHYDHHRFKELNAENLKTLCNALEKKVSWQKDIIPEIASTILQCRSGMIRRKDKSNSSRTKEDTWLFFQGGDNEGKEKIARELASIVFGSHTSFTSIGLSSFSSTRSDSIDDLRNKRSRSEAISHSYLERFAEAVRSNSHSVILMEDVEQVDYYSQMGIKSAIERGRIRGSTGEEIGLSDAIIILSCESFDLRSRACSPPIKQKLLMEGEEEKGLECEKETGSCVSLDLNLSAGLDDDNVDDRSLDDIGLLEMVDRRFFFKLQDD